MTELKKQILELHKNGMSFREISEELQCSKSTISYHCSEGQKEKNSLRRRKNVKLQHKYKKKIERFSYDYIHKTPIKQSKKTTSDILHIKIRNFFRVKTIYNKPTFTVQDVINKFGEKPVCYLTGEHIDINKTRSYAFDHKIPRSKGGSNDIDNLGICTKAANQAKHDMSPDEFLDFCKKILEHNNFKVDAQD